MGQLLPEINVCMNGRWIDSALYIRLKDNEAQEAPWYDGLNI